MNASDIITTVTLGVVSWTLLEVIKLKVSFAKLEQRINDLPCGDHKGKAVSIAGLCLLLFSVLFGAGCAAIQKNPATTERIADHVAYDITVTLLADHPDWLTEFQLAENQLLQLELQPQFDTVAVIEILQRIPAKELKTQTARIAFDGALLIVELTGNPALKPTAQEALRTIVRGLRTGIQRGIPAQLTKPRMSTLQRSKSLPPPPPRSP